MSKFKIVKVIRNDADDSLESEASQLAQFEQEISKKIEVLRTFFVQARAKAEKALGKTLRGGEDFTNVMNAGWQFDMGLKVSIDQMRHLSTEMKHKEIKAEVKK